MKKRKIGNTDIEVSELGLGCASFWGKKIFDEATAIKVVHTAIDKGVTLFDTGHSYSDGNAELRLGKALKNISTKSELVISSKAGTRFGNKGKLIKDFSPKWLRESCQLSIKRIGLDCLPLYQLHGPSIDSLRDDTLEELLKLKAEGLVKAIGINSFEEHVLERVLSLGVFDFVMPDYNILCREREPLIRKFKEKGIGVLAGAALADSLYSNRIFKIRGVRDLWYLARALKNFRSKIFKGYAYRFINNEPGLTGAQVALAYVLANEDICSAVFGTTSIEHLLENLKAAEISLGSDMVNRICLTR